VTQHGAGASPVLTGNKLILNCDQDVDSYLLTVDARTDETLWKQERARFRRGFSKKKEQISCGHLKNLKFSPIYLEPAESRGLAASATRNPTK
jgi:hypothetical protein